MLEFHLPSSDNAWTTLSGNWACKFSQTRLAAVTGYMLIGGLTLILGLSLLSRCPADRLLVFLMSPRHEHHNKGS